MRSKLTCLKLSYPQRSIRYGPVITSLSMLFQYILLFSPLHPVSILVLLASHCSSNTSEFLHLQVYTCCSPCFECSSPNLYIAGSFSLFKSLFKCHVLREDFPDFQSKVLDWSSSKHHADIILYSLSSFFSTGMCIFICLFIIYLPTRR